MNCVGTKTGTGTIGVSEHIKAVESGRIKGIARHTRSAPRSARRAETC